MKALLAFCMLLFASVAMNAQEADYNPNAKDTGIPLGSGSFSETIVANWATMASSPVPNSRAAIVLVNQGAQGTIYQFGGGTPNTEVARYDIATNSWTSGFTSIPAAVSSGTAIAVGDSNIFLFGGNSGTGTLGRTQRYNFISNTWTAMANMPTALTDAAVVQYQDSLVYVIGGGTGLFGTGYFNTIQLYNINTNTYSSTGTYPVVAGMMGFGIYKDTIITAGGWDGAAAIANAYKGVINPVTKAITWTALPNYPVGATTRIASIFVSKNTGGGILFAGGAIGGATLTASSYLWDLCNNAWAVLPNMPLARSNMKAAGRGDSVAYVVCGFTTVGVGQNDRITFSQIDGNCITGGFAGNLNPFNLQAPSAGTTITTLPGSSTPVSFTWDTSAGGAQYKLIFGSPTVPPRTLTFNSGTNAYNTTSGNLDNALASAGVSQGDSLVGQWDVWAYSVTDSLKSTNGPRAITLKRGLPALVPFNLVSPANGATVVTSALNGSPVSILWNRSGPGATYRWKYASPNFGGSIVFSLPSNGSGLDSALTIINSTLDGMLAGIGLNSGDSIVGQWRAYAYAGSDSLASAQNFNLTLKRQGIGDVLVAYDSTLANCRISRDSVMAILGSNGITFELFNRRTVAAGTGYPMRGFKKVIWLGEATSTASASQRDSIKSYLNSGTPANKSKLIIFAEDMGWQHGRTGSANLDLDLVNNYLGWNFVLDRPSTGANQGLIGVKVNRGAADSTVGTWPDVLSFFFTTAENDTLYKFRGDGSFNAIGRKAANYTTATFGHDIRSLRPAVDGPTDLSPARRLVLGALAYLDSATLVSVSEGGAALPATFSLRQNYPNPFNPTTRIEYGLPEQAHVTIAIYNLLGQKITTLYEGPQGAGFHSVDWNALSFSGSSVSSGIYFYSMRATANNGSNFTTIKKMLLLK